MSTQEVINTIQQFPIEEQKQILMALHESLSKEATQSAMTEDEFEQMLLAKGIISEIPDGLDDEDDDFEPIEVLGKPLSETVIEERR